MIIRNAKLEGQLVDIRIENELISSIVESCGKPPVEDSLTELQLDAGGRVIIPGMIDPHVHLRCPGMEQKEDWITGSRAALKGGVTSLIDMPNTIPSTETMQALEVKRRATAEADILNAAPQRFFWVGSSPENIEELAVLLNEPDVVGVKIFFSESSANASSSDIGFISRVFAIAAEAGKPAAVHSELAAMLSSYELSPSTERRAELFEHNHLRPAAAAVAGTALALELAAVAGCRLYLCHLSTMPEFAMVRKHKQAYGRNSVIAELTPHHLLLDENHIVNGGAQSWAKVNPPLRSTEDRLAAVEALLDGTIDCIGSDHAPHKLSEKDGGFHECPSGFPGLETELGLIAGFLQEQGSGWEQLTSMLVNSRTAEIFGLSDRAGIAEGKRADLVILDGPCEIDAALFETKAKYSPFNGMKMPVTIYKTIAGGKINE